VDGVLVEAPPGLATQPPGGHHAGLDRTRFPARFSERKLGERLGHLEAHIDTDQIHQLVGAHAKAAGHAADPIDRVVAGDSFLE
jgi:hypothetical protein